MINENENILKIGNTYKFVIFSCNQTLTYTGKIIEFDNNFVVFKDKYDKFFTFNINSIVSIQKLEEQK